MFEFRYAVRMLLKAPGFTLAVILLLAIGLGANTTIFSMVNGILFRPLPGITGADRVVVIGRTRHGEGWETNGSFRDFIDFRNRNTVFEKSAAIEEVAFSLAANGRTDRVHGALITPEYFDALGVSMAFGRSFQPADENVAIISHPLWETRFGKELSAIGSKIILNAHPYTIIGITNPAFRGQYVDWNQSLWVPLATRDQIQGKSDLIDRRDGSFVNMVARLKPGVTIQQANANIQGIAAQLAAEYPKENKGKGARVVAYNPVGGDNAELSIFFGILSAVTGIVLLITCANVANLLLARASVRRRELAIRISLGASSWHLARHLLSESLLLSVSAAVVSLVITLWTTDLIPRLFPLVDGMPIILNITPDSHVVLYAALLALVTSIIVTVAPIFQMRIRDAMPVVRAAENTTTPRRSRLRDTLVVAQIALCMLLLICSTLLTRSLSNLHSVDPKMKTDNLLLLEFDPERNGYSGAQTARFYNTLLDQVQQVRGVQSATLGRVVPFSGMGFAPGSVRTAPNTPDRNVDCNLIAPRYFTTLGIGILHGREFNDRDGSNAPRVAIVNETFVRRFLGGEEPLGKALYIGDEKRPWQIVGVAQDSLYRDAIESVRPFYYLPVAQSPSSHMTLHVRTAGDPLAAFDSVRETVRRLDPNLPVFQVRTMAAHLRESFWPYQLATTLIGTFGLVAMLVAILGLYGVLSYNVAQRTHEIGVRMALGANARDILRGTARYGVRLALIGLVAGVAISLAVTRLLRSVLYGVGVNDPLTFCTASAVLVIAALVACWVPARRATQVDPMVALRWE